MRLTVETNPAAVRRYGHVRPAARGRKRCGTALSGTRRRCTLEVDHRGPHVAHGLLGKVKAVWDTGRRAKVAERPRDQAVRRSPRKPVGLRDRGSSGAVETLRALAGKLASAGEEIALVVFFLAFVWFAVEWLILIFR